MELDDVNIELIDLLQADGRMSFRELGERVGLSAPAVTERVRKLEEIGVIIGYRAVIDYERIGFPLLCIIRLNSPRTSTGVDKRHRQHARGDRGVAGDWSLGIARRACPSTPITSKILLHGLWQHGDSVTNIATSAPVPHRPINVRRILTRGHRTRT